MKETKCILRCIQVKSIKTIVACSSLVCGHLAFCRSFFLPRFPALFIFYVKLKHTPPNTFTARTSFARTSFARTSCHLFCDTFNFEVFESLNDTCDIAIMVILTPWLYHTYHCYIGSLQFIYKIRTRQSLNSLLIDVTC